MFFNCWTPNVQQNDNCLLIQKGLEVIPHLPNFGSLCLLLIRRPDVALLASSALVNSLFSISELLNCYFIELFGINWFFIAVVYMVKVMNTHIDNHIAACDDQMYGVNCSQKCGACVDNGACHHINGSCLKGCDKGYHGQKCDQGNFGSSS